MYAFIFIHIHVFTHMHNINIHIFIYTERWACFTWCMFSFGPWTIKQKPQCKAGTHFSGWDQQESLVTI